MNRIVLVIGMFTHEKDRFVVARKQGESELHTHIVMRNPVGLLPSVNGYFAVENVEGLNERNWRFIRRVPMP